jgi:glycosyltransferase involved in cell wall biosynthesis
MNDLISVILPVFNGEKYLSESIESILNQTYANFEFIIINDGSSDKSLKIINKYNKLDKRILVISRGNKGLIASLNEGIEKSKGKYIARMDQDDISLPRRLEEQLSFMKKNIDIGVCGSWVEVFGEGIKPYRWKLSCSNERLKTELLFSACFAHPSVMIRRRTLTESNLYYDKNFLNAEDFGLWTELSSVTNFANINKVLIKYRIVNTSVTRIADQDQDQRYRVISKIFDKYLIQLNIKNNQEENRLHFNLSVNTRIRDNNLSFNILEKYFTKLVLANNTTKVFPSFELYKVLGKKWLWNLFYKKEIKAIFSRYFFYGIWSALSR